MKGFASVVPLASPLDRQKHVWTRHSSAIILGALLGLLLVLQLNYFEIIPRLTSVAPVPNYDGVVWDKLKPGKHLNYASCYNGVQCARLELPLDWKDQHNPKTLDLAVLRVPASVPVGDHRYAGAIIINPGGPGGSGVGAALSLGRLLQTLLDTDDKRFDIISFDPRGVGFTTPLPHCFDDRQSRFSFSQRHSRAGILNSSDVILAEAYYTAKAVGGACATNDEDSIKHHMTTPYVASDMLALVEAHGIWREKQIHGRVTSHFDPKKELLQYWGFSYGTLLGGTFASLYPDRVGRVVLDGVVDSDDYYSASWSGNLVDTEAVADAFYSSCATAGPERCALATQHTKHGANIRALVEAFLADLKVRPIAVTTHHEAQLITYSDVKTFIFRVLYSPARFEDLAYVLAPLIHHRNGSILAARLRAEEEFSCSKSESASDQGASAVEGGAHILCTDSDSWENKTLADADHHLKNMLAKSPSIGDIWAAIPLACVGITTRSPWTFDRTQYGANKTANPVLFVGNTADPVTPLVNAYAMQKKFVGSGVLVQDGVGHCSTAEFSKCTARALSKYFTEGKLPEKGKTCAVDWLPFRDGTSSREEEISSMSEGDARVARAHIEIEEVFRKEGWGLGRGLLGRRFED